MTSENFGYNDDEVIMDINLSEITSVYIDHPKTLKEYTKLKQEIESYSDRPEYDSAVYVYTDIVKVSDFKLRKNVGRKKGNDNQVYATVEKNLSKGYKKGKFPPVVLRNNGQLNEWLVNGNHRWLWYCNNGYSHIIVDVYEPKEGFEDEDVVDEIGLLHQPQPDGTSSSREDYVARGKKWVERRTNSKLTTTNQDVDNWVEKFAKNECPRFRTDLKKSIYNKSVKNEFLTNYNRIDVKKFYREEANIVILDSNAEVRSKIVHRLFEASQNVFIRDFWSTFLVDASKGITTVLNFYVGTGNIDDANGIQICINNRLKELDLIFNKLDDIIPNSGTKLRKFLIFGTRPPQIVDMDDYQKPVTYPVNFNAPNAPKKAGGLVNMSLQILDQNFVKGVPFSIEQADAAVYPIRSTISAFKDKKSFRGTLLAELQKLRDLNRVEFIEGKKGWYSLL